MKSKPKSAKYRNLTIWSGDDDDRTASVAPVNLSRRMRSKRSLTRPLATRTTLAPFRAENSSGRASVESRRTKLTISISAAVARGSTAATLGRCWNT